MKLTVPALLDIEARALLTRLNRIKPFVLTEPMVPAAGLHPAAQIAIERCLAQGQKELRERVTGFLGWLQGKGQAASPEKAQRQFVFLRMRFNAVLSQLDLFSDVITQRSEHENGVWLAGLDAVAADALALPAYYRMPPVICYLDRGIGAAIRRARTRLPGGGKNPVAIIRVPRERMIGSGIASSLVHEVGHQGSVLLDLVTSMRPVLQAEGNKRGEKEVWTLFERWISEIFADFWSVARVGVTSTLGLVGVVSLPRAFVFRMNSDAPHPMPWLRVKLSCAMGNALYPHPQWQGIAQMWESFYPLAQLAQERRNLIDKIQEALPNFINLLVHHRPKLLTGKSLLEAMDTDQRQPKRLLALFRDWSKNPNQMYQTAPALAFAVLGQAKIDRLLSPEDESELLAKLLNYWAMRNALDMSSVLYELTYDAGTSVY